MNATYKQLLNHGYTREVVASYMANNFHLDKLSRCTQSNYFLLRYSYAKFIERFNGNLLTGVGTIEVGDTTYATILRISDTTHATEGNIEISFRSALQQYELPAIALIKEYHGIIATNTHSYNESEKHNHES